MANKLTSEGVFRAFKYWHSGKWSEHGFGTVWPDGFGEKVAQTNFFVKINAVENHCSKLRSISVSLKNLPIENNCPMCQNSPNLVTLFRNTYVSSLDLVSLCISFRSTYLFELSKVSTLNHNHAVFPKINQRKCSTF
jgi:hypothetical protein